MAVQESGVLSIMNAYNLINGRHCSENPDLLHTILRDRWGFPFYVVSDWGAVHNSKRAIEAGTDICMGSSHYENDLPGLVGSGSVSEETLNNAVRNVLRTKMLAGMLDNYPRAPSGLINSEDHQILSLEAARKVMVLLKNENNILPLAEESISKIALIGPSANKAQLDGFGSSWVEPIYTVSPRQGLINKIGGSKIIYSYGCAINSQDTTGFASARIAASQADYVIFVGGLDDTQEGEGYGNRPEYDRAGGSIQLPGKQQDLINELFKVNENILVVIKSGGICGLNQCFENIKGLVYAFYPGQEGGNAIADVLFGDYNPGGKLPVTMPKTDSQLPAWNDNFNDDFGCGYRWFDEMEITPQYSFGHGLSYTSFNYSNLNVSTEPFTDKKPLTVTFDISNTGNLEGEEVVQLYISDVESTIWMPEKQLKGFERVSLSAGETKTISIELNLDDFYFWDEITDTYSIEPGMFNVMVGGSSDDLQLHSSFEISPQLFAPDLKPTKIFTVPRFPVEGDTLSMICLVQNIGSEEILPGDEIEIQFFADNNLIATGNYQDLNIPVGGMAMIEANNNSWIIGDPGEYQINALVDPENKLAEIIENNNQAQHSLDVLDSLTLILQNNLALFKPVTASSSESNELLPENAVDGNLGTRWSSLFSDPQEFVVNLKDLYDIIQIRIHWETAYSKSFIISASEDSINWEDIVIENNGDGNIDEFNIEATAQYLRFTGIQRATQWGHSFYEFQVFGKRHEMQDPTSVEFNNDLKEIRIYPNPAIDKIYFSNFDPALRFDFKIFNLEGQLMLSGKSNAGNLLELPDYSPGIYILELYHEGRTTSFKILIQ